MASGHLPFVGPRSVGWLFAQELTDSEATRRVFLTVGGLLLLGLALLIATVWWWRSTRPEHPVLGPLEVMSERRWAKSDGDSRRSLIDARRRPNAEPDDVPAAVAGVAGVPGFAVVGGSAASADRLDRFTVEPEPVDLSVLVRSGAPPLDDLAAIDRLLGLVPDDEDSDAEAMPVADADEVVNDEVAEPDSAAHSDEDEDVAEVAVAVDEVPVGDASDLVEFVQPDGHDVDGHDAVDVDDVDDGVSSGAEIGDVIDPLLQRTSAKD